jgi:hypothetical protein
LRLGQTTVRRASRVESRVPMPVPRGVVQNRPARRTRLMSLLRNPALSRSSWRFSRLGTGRLSGMM